MIMNISNSSTNKKLRILLHMNLALLFTFLNLRILRKPSCTPIHIPYNKFIQTSTHCCSTASNSKEPVGCGGILVRKSFCGAECRSLFEKTLRDGFEISITNVNGVVARRLTPIVSPAKLDSTARAVVRGSRRASLHVEVLKEISLLRPRTGSSTGSDVDRRGGAVGGGDMGSNTGGRVTTEEKAPILMSTRTFIDKRQDASPHVSFGPITIYVHARLPGGSNGVPSTGIPLGLGWECVRQRSTSVDEFEQLKCDALIQESSAQAVDSSGDDGSWRFHRDGRLEPQERLAVLAQHGWDDKEQLAAMLKQMKQINNDRMSTVRSRTGKMVLRGEDPDEVAVWEAAVLAGKPDPLQGTSLTKPVAAPKPKNKALSRRRASVMTPMAGSMARRGRANTVGAVPLPKGGEGEKMDAKKMKFLFGAKPKTLKKSNRKNGKLKGRGGRTRAKTLLKVASK